MKNYEIKNLAHAHSVESTQLEIERTARLTEDELFLSGQE